MGGRGSASGLSISSKRAEDIAQANDAKENGRRLGAKYYEYTDSTGKKITGDTGRGAGGTYRASYDEEVARYARMSTNALEKELNALKNKSTENYQLFARSAASRSASQVSAFADADAKIRRINQVLRRRKRNRK